MEKTGIARVNYFSRQVLRTADFIDEQAYHLEARRRHNIGHHVWGIVAGLELRLDKDGTAFVTPGFAIDGFGRELLLPSGRAVPARAFEERLAESLDVWIIYSRTAGDFGDPSYQPCTDPVNYRWSEIAAIEWTRSTEPVIADPELGMPECRQPESLDPEYLTFDATRVAPDDPVVRWPVFLGRVDRTRTGTDTKFTIDMAGRPYAGARAEAIIAPSEDARVQVGPGCGADPYQFAVLLKTPPQPGVEPRLLPRLALDTDGNWQIAGNTSIRGDVKVEGAVEFPRGSDFTAQRAWQIYRATGDPTDLARNFDELRIETGTAGGATNEFVVGVFSKGEFKPCLTVGQDCTVTVHGDLIVNGTLSSGPRVAQTLSQQTNAIAASVFIGGLMQSLNLAVGGQPPGKDVLLAAMQSDPDGAVATLTAMFQQQPELFNRIREELAAAEDKKQSRRGKAHGPRGRGLPKTETDSDNEPPQG